MGFEVKCLRRIGDRDRVDEISDESLEELDEGFADAAGNVGHKSIEGGSQVELSDREGCIGCILQVVFGLSYLG